MILLTCLFYLGLARLGGGHDSCSGLCDAAGRVLQAVQLGAVFVCFHLERKSSKHQTTEAIQSFAVILPFFSLHRTQACFPHQFTALVWMQNMED